MVEKIWVTSDLFLIELTALTYHRCHPPSHLARHLKVHTEGKLKCEICNIKFTVHALRWHRKVVHGTTVADLKCETCEARFKKRHHLSNIHCNGGNERAFLMEILFFAERHREVHKRGNVKCNRCNIRFTPKSLLWHQKQHCHPGLIKHNGGTDRCKICTGFVKNHHMGKEFSTYYLWKRVSIGARSSEIFFPKNLNCCASCCDIKPGKFCNKVSLPQLNTWKCIHTANSNANCAKVFASHYVR